MSADPIAVYRIELRSAAERRTTKQRRRFRAAVAVTAAAAAILVVGGAIAAGTGFFTSHPIAPRIVPRAVQERLDRLNLAYTECMAAHGSQEVPLDGGGWTYEKNVAAQSICKPTLDAIAGYVSSPEYRANDARAQDHLRVFWACVERLQTRDDQAVQRCADQASETR
jgi:hypothetical protein